jgi:hypothetical protein
MGVAPLGRSAFAVATWSAVLFGTEGREGFAHNAGTVSSMPRPCSRIPLCATCSPHTGEERAGDSESFPLTGGHVCAPSLRARPARRRESSFRARCTPHRSERALLTHSAPASGSDVKALLGPGMKSAGARDPSVGDRQHASPVDRALLASTPRGAAHVDVVVDSLGGLDDAPPALVFARNLRHQRDGTARSRCGATPGETPPAARDSTVRGRAALALLLREDPGQGARSEMPEGFEVGEKINGIVSVRRKRREAPGAPDADVKIVEGERDFSRCRRRADRARERPARALSQVDTRCLVLVPEG